MYGQTWVAVNSENVDEKVNVFPVIDRANQKAWYILTGVRNGNKDGGGSENTFLCSHVHEWPVIVNALHVTISTTIFLVGRITSIVSETVFRFFTLKHTGDVYHQVSFTRGRGFLWLFYFPPYLNIYNQ